MNWVDTSLPGSYDMYDLVHEGVTVAWIGIVTITVHSHTWWPQLCNTDFGGYMRLPNCASKEEAMAAVELAILKRIDADADIITSR